MSVKISCRLQLINVHFRWCIIQTDFHDCIFNKIVPFLCYTGFFSSYGFLHHLLGLGIFYNQPFRSDIIYKYVDIWLYNKIIVKFLIFGLFCIMKIMWVHQWSWGFFFHILIYLFCVYVYVWGPMPQCMYRGRGTIYRSQFSPFTMCVGPRNSISVHQVW